MAGIRRKKGADMDGPSDILPTYQAVAWHWDRDRNLRLFERPALDGAIALAPGGTALDLGCGSGRPVARYLRARGLRVLGVDGAGAMCALYRRHLHGPVLCRDMRTLALGRRFDLILGWNSFFHLNAADQRAMFAVFAAHARPGAALILTTGPRAGEAVGRVADRPVYHASLAPRDYAQAMRRHGFDPVWFRPEWGRLLGHSVWLARYAGRGPRH